MTEIHIAIIPDGNRRWAKRNKLKSIFGHQKGADTFETAIRFCIKNNIKYLSMYAFSLENFNRSEAEKKYLFDLFLQQGESNLDEVATGTRLIQKGTEQDEQEHKTGGHAECDAENAFRCKPHMAHRLPK